MPAGDAQPAPLKPDLSDLNGNSHSLAHLQLGVRAIPEIASVAVVIYVSQIGLGRYVPAKADAS